MSGSPFCLPHVRTRVLPIILQNSTDPQVAMMHQNTQQCANKVREEGDCKLVDMDVNDAGFKVLYSLQFCKCFMRK